MMDVLLDLLQKGSAPFVYFFLCLHPLTNVLGYWYWLFARAGPRADSGLRGLLAFPFTGGKRMAALAFGGW